MEKELLSVVVPVYNVKPYLRRCLDSVLNQTYRNLEIILVDDGSTDGSDLVCDEYKNKDSRIHVIHKQNGGLVSARQKGTSMATGKYITQVDSDDWIDVRMYEELMELALEHQADVVTSGTIKEYGNHNVREKEIISFGLYRGLEIQNDLLPFMIATNDFYETPVSPHIWNKIYRTNLYKKYQMIIPTSINMSEDAAVVYPLLHDAETVVISGKEYYHYCIRNNSVCGGDKNEIDSIKMLEKHFETMLGRGKWHNPYEKLQYRLVISYSQVFAASSLFFENGEMLRLPYEKVGITDKIILYGAGKFGQILKKYIDKDAQYDLVAWVDKDPKEGCIFLEDALLMEYDVVLIGIAASALAKSVYGELIEKGVSEEKIRRISVKKVLGEIE